MKRVIILTMEKEKVTAIRGCFSNLKKAVAICEKYGMKDNYMKVYREVKEYEYYSWVDNNIIYKFVQKDVL